jgi:hypothetical protein
LARQRKPLIPRQRLRQPRHEFRAAQHLGDVDVFVGLVGLAKAALSEQPYRVDVEIARARLADMIESFEGASILWLNDIIQDAFLSTGGDPGSNRAKSADLIDQAFEPLAVGGAANALRNDATIIGAARAKIPPRSAIQ